MRLRLPLVALCASIFAPAVFPAPADEVNRTPPALYTEQLAPQLTPLRDVVAGKSAFPDDKSGGIVLLSEHLRYRDRDGVEYRLSHNICAATNQAGVKSLSTDTFNYDRERESIFLIDAATILSDGTRVPIEDKGAFIQTPQHEAQNSLYTSQAELHLIFPQIAPGAIVETVVLVRENTPVMPGEFAGSRTFGASWPIYLHRFIVDLPTADWERVRSAGTTVGVPAPEIEPSGPGRERRTWTKRQVPRTPWEYFSPPYPFLAPTLWLTTLRSWDDLARWYAGQVADRSQLGPDLAAAVDQTTSGLTERMAIIEALHRLASEEVRYTGLEFGLAGYRPHACDEVWQKRYGDCKDKATLLRAMLARKGIAAHLVLLNTGGNGQIEKASPTWQQFNHVILAVDNAHGGYLFCDPTAKHLPAGTLGLGDLARDVLILHDDHAEWFHTPDALTAAIKISADLALSAEGELSGWFTLDATGSDAASYAEYLNALDSQGLHKSMQDLVGLFFGGAEAYDIEYQPLRGAVSALRCRVFLVRPSRAAQGTSLRFPYPTNWVQPVDNDGDRRYPYSAIRRENSVEIAIKLPDTLGVTKLPEPFSAPSDVAQFDGRWESTDHRLVAHLNFHPARAELSPTEFPVFQRSTRALLAWLDQPVVLAAGGATAVVAPSAKDSLPDFPVLSNAEGQFRLLEERYSPTSGKIAQRRLALGKILQWFPQDSDAVFQANLLLAELDHGANDQLAFADAVAALLAQHGTKLSAIHRSWGEFREACARWSASKDPASVAKLQSLANDESLPLYRRCWSANAAGLALIQDQPRKAAAFLAPFTELESDARPSLVSIAACAYTRAGDMTGLRDWTSRLIARSGASADPLLAGALGALVEDRANAPAGQLAQALATIGAVANSAITFPKTSPLSQNLQGMLAAEEAQQRFVNALSSWLIQHPPAWWTARPLPQYRDTASLIAQIEKEHANRNTKVVLDLIFQLLLHHQPDYPTFGKYAYWALWYLDTRRIENPLLDYASQLSMDLPAAFSSDVVEMQMVRAYYLRRTGDANGARAVFHRLLAGPEAKDYQRVEIGGELGLLELEASRPEEAFTAWRTIEPLFQTHKRGFDYIYTVLLAQVEHGQYDQALNVLTRLREQKKQNGEDAFKNRFINHLLATSTQPELIKDYWTRALLTHDAWEKIRTEFKISPSFTVALINDSSLTAELEKASKTHDDTEFLANLDALVRQAGCVPDYALQLAAIVSRHDSPNAPLLAALRQYALALVRTLPPIDPDTDHSARLLEAEFLDKLNRGPEAAAICEALFREIGTSSPVGTEALCRWEMYEPNPTKKAAAQKTARDLLAGDTPVANRLLAVHMSTFSLSKAEERTLLERETTRADFDRTSPPGRELLTRLEELRNTGLSGVAFTQHVQAWCDAPGLHWVQRLHPLTLADPAFADQKTVIWPGDSSFTDSERFKFNLLLALDEATEQGIREDAYVLARESEAESRNSFADYTEKMLTLADDTALTANSRAYAIQLATIRLVNGRQPALLARCIAHPRFAERPAQYCKSIRAAATALDILKTDATDRHRRAFAIVIADPLDWPRLSLATDILQSLAFSGDVAGANKLVADAGDLAIGPNLRSTVAGVRLQWTRAIRAAQELAPVLRQLDAIFQQIPEAQQPCPPQALDLIHDEEQASLTQEESLAWAGYRLHLRDGVVAQLPAIIQSLHFAQESHPQLTESVGALLDAVTAQPMSDAPMQPLLSALCASLDTDDPTIWTKLSQALERLHTEEFAESHPQTEAAIARICVQQALRSSLEERPAALFDPVHTRELPPQFVRSMQIGFLATRGHKLRCLALLETLDPNLIALNGVPPAALRLIQQNADTPDRAAYLEASANRLRLKQEALWLAPYQNNAWNSLRGRILASADTTADALALIAHLKPHYRNQIALAMLDLDEAVLHQEPTGILRAADALLTPHPSFYDAYFHRAQAHQALGHAAAARADYDIFLKYCLDSAYYQEALAARRALEGKP